MAGRFTRYVPVRMEEKEYERLRAEAEKAHYENFSEFIRDTLLEHNGFRSRALKRKLYDLEWEINKIGVNINQATKRINSGYGSHQDVKELLASQKKLELLLEQHISEIEKTWQ